MSHTALALDVWSDLQMDIKVIPYFAVETERVNMHKYALNSTQPVVHLIKCELSSLVLLVLLICASFSVDRAL